MFELSEEIWQTIRRNKWRSLMTAFGVFWGLLMLILLVGLGHGVFNGIVNNLTVIPSNTMFFGGGATSMEYRGFGKDRSISVENKDLEVIKRNLGDRVRYVTPLVFAGSKKVVSGENTYDGTVVGTSPSYYYAIPQRIMYGRYLNQVDMNEQRKVCLIGRDIYETLYPGGGDPTGKLIQVGDIYFSVIGVVEKLSSMINIGADVNRSVIVTAGTAQLAYNMGRDVHVTGITLHDKYPIADWEERILSIEKELHIVHPDDKQAFWSFNIAEILNMFSALFMGINVLLWIVGSGSLIAGLIGISNIMLVTVKERTQEIGIRRALGAKPATILTQIMAESLVLTSAAGITGLMLGVWILQLISRILEVSGAKADTPLQDPQIPFTVAVSALIVIILGGLLAGWMPANRAMKIRAIEALREE